MTEFDPFTPISLEDALKAEMVRVIDHVVPVYMNFGRAGRSSLDAIQDCTDYAHSAIAGNNVIKMKEAIFMLKGWKK